MEESRLQGLDCVRLSNGALTLVVTRSVGPRVLALHWQGSANLFAELPGLTLDGAARGRFHFRGGHRLWHAPELPARTYVPDDEPVEIEPVENGIVATAPVEPDTGLQKRLAIRLEGERVYLDHTLINHGLWPVECAPWAITQMRPGGVAILPQATLPADPHGLLPNRALVLWPYTDPASPSLRIGKAYLRVTAPAGEEGRLKVGFPNPRGWLAYHLEGVLFVKRAPFDPQATYFDMGASTQLYAGTQFVELETLGPCSRLGPGGRVSHEERWELHGVDDFDDSDEGMARLVEALELG